VSKVSCLACCSYTVCLQELFIVLSSRPYPLMTGSAEGVHILTYERCAQAGQRPQARKSNKRVAPSSEREELKGEQPVTPSTIGGRKDNGQGLSEQQRRQKSQSQQPRHPGTSSSVREKQEDNAEGLSERQRRRRRVGWALHQRRTGLAIGKGTKPDKQKPDTRNFTRRLGSSSAGKYRCPSRICIRLASKVACRHSCCIGHRCHYLLLTYGGLILLAARTFQHQIDRAASSGTTSILVLCLVAKHRLACIRWVISHVQGVNQEELLMKAKASLIKSAEVFDVSKGARLTSFA
jgi:hypothetical protein